MEGVDLLDVAAWEGSASLRGSIGAMRTITITVTNKEYDLLGDLAFDAHKSIAAYVREVALRDTKPLEDTTETVAARIEEWANGYWEVDPSYVVGKDDLYWAFLWWSDTRGYPRVTRVSFGRALKSLGMEYVRETTGKRRYIYQGFQARPLTWDDLRNAPR